MKIHENNNNSSQFLKRQNLILKQPQSNLNILQKYTLEFYSLDWHGNE